MSILLEALRKSEKNQHLREAPTIHSDDQPDSASEPLPAGMLALMLVVTLFVSGWFVWRQYRPPTVVSQPPVTQVVNETQVDSTPKPEEKQGNQATNSESDANTSSAQTRTPVESYEPPVSDDSQPEPVVQDAASASVAQKTDNTQARPRQASSTEPAEEQFHPGEPEPITYWELPDAVRASVPEIKFSVLVFATKPEDRFVLINGERLGEGDSAQPGLVVKEIRRDGVIFSYQLYQFLVER
ncbi:MAG: general secretion pathway protein GspB [Xanthomonadales bacterium]|nr:general secretion pathway protein GspB [Xanthomonadales bacterium]MDH4019187.1 general secretion pathway protein GspB [Xanthomonadales bacterium]